MARPVQFRIHNAAIASFMDPGDAVDDLVWDTLKTTRDLAILYAPMRTGTLKRSIRANRPHRTGLFTNSGIVYSNARHALWVHDGTPRIYPRGRWLTVPNRPGHVSGAALRHGGPKSGPGRMYFLTHSVRGQRPQPFLADALHVAMAGVDVGITRLA